MDRRKFLRTSFSGAALIGASPALISAYSKHDPLHDFGIISGVLSNELKMDPRGTLEKVAAMGYKYLESGSAYGMEIREYKKFMRSIGLRSIVGGASMANFEGDGLHELIDIQLELGNEYMVCYWPWIKDPSETTREDLKPIAERLNNIGEECNKNGLRFAYHNHDHEFTVAADGKAYDFFLENTEADKVCMEFDLYWASVGGVDPNTYIEKYPGRFELLHVKDAYDLKERESFACVGKGVINFERIFKLRDIGGFKHLIVEKDNAQHGIECAKTSIEYLNSLNF